MAEPLFSREMLRGFLYARALTVEGFEGRVMAARLKRELRKATGLPDSTLEAAFAGRLTDPASRAAIWAVLGHFPGARGITLTDDGGQSVR